MSATGGHASAPHQATSALEIGNAIVNGLKGFNPLGPLEPLALVPTIFKSGTASNIIPER